MNDKKFTSPETCDRFEKCSANICPLDKDWNKRTHLKGERFCFYMIEAEKLNADMIFEGRGRGHVLKLIRDISQEISSRHYTIKNALQSAKVTGSRMARKIGM